MAFRGIRGATTVETNTRDAVLAATHELLAELIRVNKINKEDVASAFFSTTPDINAEFPAVAARNGFGWGNVALMCGHEMSVPGSLKMCLRVRRRGRYGVPMQTYGCTSIQSLLRAEIVHVDAAATNAELGRAASGSRLNRLSIQARRGHYLGPMVGRILSRLRRQGNWGLRV